MRNLVIHKDYPCHVSNYKKGRTAAGDMYLVFHYVGAMGGAQANAKYYGTTPKIGASAHYFVGHAPDAEIWASVPEADTAWHCGAAKYVHTVCRNGNSIGVELCCHQATDGTWYFDPETVDAAVALGRDIVRRYNIPPERVLRHYDVTGKICPAPFVHDQVAWTVFKARLFSDAVHADEKGDPGDPGIGNIYLHTEPADWAKTAWDKAKTKGIMDGTRPWENITRQEVAVILDRCGLLEGGDE